MQALVAPGMDPQEWLVRLNFRSDLGVRREPDAYGGVDGITLLGSAAAEVNYCEPDFPCVHAGDVASIGRQKRSDNRRRGQKPWVLHLGQVTSLGGDELAELGPGRTIVKWLLRPVGGHPSCVSSHLPHQQHLRSNIQTMLAKVGRTAALQRLVLPSVTSRALPTASPRG